MAIHSGQFSDFQRPVSPIEWWFLGVPAKQSEVIQFVVEGAGRVELAALAAAVGVAAEANPGVRLVRRGRIWVDSGECPPVRLVSCASTDPRHRILELPQLQEPLPVGRGPKCEVMLIVGSSSAVVFRGLHLVMDGRGLEMWASDVFRVLRGEQPFGARDTISEIDVLKYDRYAEENNGRSRMDFPSIFERRPTANPRTLWRRRTIDGYHPASAATVATAIAELAGAETSRFVVPVDLRRHVPEVLSTANLSNRVILDINRGQSWEDSYEQQMKLLADKRDLLTIASPTILKIPVPLLRLANRLITHHVAKTNMNNATATISHLGRVDLSDYCAPSFEARTVYACATHPPIRPTELMMTECGGRTEITLAQCDGPGVAQRADEVLDCVEEVLSPRVNRREHGNDTVGNDTVGSVGSVALMGVGATQVTVVQRFAEQVARSPDATAISSPEAEVSYAELERRSRVVAAQLRARGVGRGSVVGVLAGRSVAAIAGIWGVLRAGAAYVPLDIRNPDARLAGLLSDTGAVCALVEAPYDERAAIPDGCEAIVMDSLDYTHPPKGWSDAPVAAGDLAYVIYTSGSTGKPKGVQIEHGSLINYVQWATRELGVDSSTRLPLIVSLSFDLSVTSIFLPPLAGAVLVLMGSDTNHTTLRDLLNDCGPTVLSLTPSHLDLICQLDMKPVGVKVVKSIGEVLKRSLAVKAQETFGADCRIINMYGPTEVTVACTMHLFDAERDLSAGVPIGVGGDNSSVVLLDPNHRFVAAGQPGEMYLGGVQLARGYRGQPDLDREKFYYLADGRRMYRSGDIARRLPSGDLEFISRIDDQVKVLGHRIEPAEIAQCLEQHPEVLSAAVLVRTRPGQDTKTLCAYVVRRPGMDTEVTAHAQGDRDQTAAAPGDDTRGDNALGDDADCPAVLEAFLAERLPPYMMPAAIVTVKDIPMNINGKVDGNALPDPFAARTSEVRAPVQRDETGSAVAAIWARILLVDPYRVDDEADFHDLGGNSLLLLTIVAAVCKEVIGPDGERAFMADFGQIVRHTTLAHLTELTRKYSPSLPPE